MAEAIFQHLVDQAGLADHFLLDSAGTGSWHAGEPVHPGTQSVLRRNGIQLSHRARQVDPSDLRDADYLVAMDSSNFAELRSLDRQTDLTGRLFMLLDFAPDGTPIDVPDPYYEDNFDRVYELVEAGCRGLLVHIRAERGF